MESVFLVYKTDAQHSYASRDIIGIATDELKALRICLIQSEKEGFKIDPDNRKHREGVFYELSILKQTQSYKGPGEFQFEEIQVNTLL